MMIQHQQYECGVLNYMLLSLDKIVLKVSMYMIINEQKC